MQKVVLDNGVRIILKHKDCNIFLFQTSVMVGSAYEREGQKGYSHLLEHTLFEGTARRRDAKAISEEIENLGGEINASTGNESTHYYAKVLHQDAAAAIDIVSDLLLNSLFEADKIEKEQRVVLEEIKTVNDSPRSFQWIQFEKTLFAGTPHSSPVYGTVEDVSAATRDSLLNFYHEHYVPENMIITAIGNIKGRESLILDEIKKRFSSLPQKKKPSIEFPIPVSKSGVNLVIEKDLQQLYLIQGALTPNILSRESAALEVIQAILGKPQSGRVNHEIRNKLGLAYDVHVSYESFSKFGFFAISIGADQDHNEHIKKVLEKLWLLEDVTETEMACAKQFIIGQTVMEVEDPQADADMITYWEALTGRSDYGQEYLSKIGAVTIDEIKEAARLLRLRTEVMLVPKVRNQVSRKKHLK